MAAEAAASSNTSRKSGLQLPNMTVSRISGPVTLYYLKPSSAAYATFHKEGMDLPLLLLFGDQHRSDSGMCEECTCEDDNCCKLIYDKEFIKEFDKIAQNTPVDFYTESSRSKETYVKKGKNILFKDFINNTVKDCHRVSLRTTAEYTQKCPTKFIRWHYGDLRAFPSAIEGFMLFPIRDYINSISEAPYRTTYDWMSRAFRLDIRHVSDTVLYRKTEAYNLAFLSDLRQPLLEEDPTFTKQDAAMMTFMKRKREYPFHSFQEYAETIKNSEFQEAVESIRDKFKDVITSQMDAYMNIIVYTLYQINDDRTRKFRNRYIHFYLLGIRRVIEHINTYFNVIEEASKEGLSGIFKQLGKQSASLIKSVDKWKELVIENSIRRYDLIDQFILLDRYQAQNTVLFNQLYDKIVICAKDPPDDMSAYSLKQYESNTNSDELIHRILDCLYTLISFFNSNTLDVYTITRMLKTPVRQLPDGTVIKETQATLSLGFFGNAHIRKMVSIFLSPLFQYELVYYRMPSSTTNKRCLSINMYVPLMDDIEKHHQLRFEGDNNYQKQNEYYHRLRSEQRSRMSSMKTRKQSHKHSIRRKPSLKKSHVKTVKNT
jgi:hypothetical protein